MNIKKISFVAIIALFGILLSSCESDRFFWTTGVFDRNDSFYTDYDGVIYDAFRVDFRNVFPDDYGVIEDIKIYGNDKITLSIRSYDRLDDLRLQVAGTNAKVDFFNLVNTETFYGGDVAYLWMFL